MTEEQIRSALLEQLRRVAPDVDPAALDPAADLREQADLDSVDVANLVVALHEELGVDVPETDYRELETVDRAVAYLSGRLGP
jgi:acyl carrier protein